MEDYEGVVKQKLCSQTYQHCSGEYNHEESSFGVFFGGVANDSCCAASATDDDGA